MKLTTASNKEKDEAAAFAPYRVHSSALIHKSCTRRANGFLSIRLHKHDKDTHLFWRSITEVPLTILIFVQNRFLKVP